MLLSVRRLQPIASRISQVWRQRALRCYSTGEEREHDPLNILFCGADEFSIYSLRALHALHQQQPSKIESITVLCKTDKAVDRGLRKTRAPPVKAVATELGLQLHQIQTFREFRSPDLYNLVVAVSFGLLVPRRVLDSAKYGGLNVHPSMLPDLRGSAPIMHTLLKRRPSTGVSLQTMHPTKFDHGKVLARTAEVPVQPNNTPQDLLQKLGPLGADLLCKGINSVALVTPSVALTPRPFETRHTDVAPKITSEDRHIYWSSWTADEILLRDRVLGDLWDEETFARCQALRPTEEVRKRLTFHGPWVKSSSDVHDGVAGQPQLVHAPSRKGLTLGIRTIDGYIAVPQAVTIEGKKKGKGLQALNEHLRLRRKTVDGPTQTSDSDSHS